MVYSATVENNGDEKFPATVGNYAFAMGKGGAGAIDAMMATLCACVGHHVRDRLIERKLAFSGFVMKAETEKSSDRLRLSRVTVRLEVRGAKLSEADKADLQSQAGHCPIYNTLSRAAEITFSVA